MRLLFCNVAWMKFYKGRTPGVDVPDMGGAYVAETGCAHEDFNFFPTPMVFEDHFMTDGKYCLGFVETKATSGSKVNQLHIERIEGCAACGREEFVDDVLVVYCAAQPSYHFTTVVGWYKHARVFRGYQLAEFEGGYEQSYNAIARVEDCVLLPDTDRSKVTKWKVPRRSSGASFGFGRSNIWFAEGRDENPYLDDFLRRLERTILDYQGENWVDKFPD